MKKVIFVLVLITTISMSMFAQDKGKGRGHGGIGQPMIKELNLSDEQNVQFQSLNKEFQGKMKELRQNESLSKEEKSVKMKELRDSHQASFIALLTPEQKEKAEQKFKELSKVRPHKEGRPHGGDFKDNPNLSDETKAKLTTLKEEFEKSKKAIKMSRVAPEEQKRRLEELETKMKADRKAIFEANKK